MPLDLLELWGKQTPGLDNPRATVWSTEIKKNPTVLLLFAVFQNFSGDTFHMIKGCIHLCKSFVIYICTLIFIYEAFMCQVLIMLTCMMYNQTAVYRKPTGVYNVVQSLWGVRGWPQGLLWDMP